MSFIRNSFGDFDIVCEYCGSNDIFGADFYEALAEAKEDGWIVFKDATEGWLHFCCPECQDDYLK